MPFDPALRWILPPSALVGMCTCNTTAGHRAQCALHGPCGTRDLAINYVIAFTMYPGK